MARLLRLQSTSLELLDHVAELLSIVISEDQSLVEGVADFLPSIIRRMSDSPKDQRMQKAWLQILAISVVLGYVSAQSLQDIAAVDVVNDALVLFKADSQAVSHGLLILWKLSSYRQGFLGRSAVMSALEIMKEIIASDIYSVEHHAAIFGFIANVTETPDLKLSDLPLRALLDSSFDSLASEAS